MPTNRSFFGRKATLSDADAPKRVAEQLRWTVGRPSVPEFPSRQGEPRELIETWLQLLVERDFITRYDLLADEPYVDHDMPLRRVYYVVEAYMGMTRDDVQRQMYRFDFVSSDALVAAVDKQIETLSAEARPDDPAAQDQLALLRDDRQRLSAEKTEFLTRHSIVKQSDPDYARLMVK